VRRRETAMEEKVIRERIRQRLALGQLKHHDGMIVVAPMGGRQPCQACGIQIDSSYATPVGHAYASGTQWFHQACRIFWDEERKPTMPVDETVVRHA
jgi:hypothetical protein